MILHGHFKKGAPGLYFSGEHEVRVKDLNRATRPHSPYCFPHSLDPIVKVKPVRQTIELSGNQRRW